MKRYTHHSEDGVTTRELTESNDMLIIRSNNGFDPISILKPIALSKGIASVKEIDEFPEASVYVYKLVHDNPGQLKHEIKSELNNLHDSQIKYVGSLYQNEYKQYQIYTGNIFIKFYNNVPESVHDQIFAKYDIKIKKKLQLENITYFAEPRAELGRNIFEFVETILKHESSVELCTPEIVVKRKSITFHPKDEVEEPETDMDWALKMINVHEAWKITKGKGVKICIIDDGIDLEHEAFTDKHREVKTIDLFDDAEGPATPKFENENHGTACASIACSSDPLAPGIAPEADLMVVRTKGLGSILEAEAIRWAVDNGADIISCSWGPSDGVINDPSDDDIIYKIPPHTRLALNYAVNKGRDGKGCLVFFAAGNGKEKIINDEYASHSGVMAIGSVNKDGKASAFSDFGHPLLCCFPSSDVVWQRDRYIQPYGLITADRIGKLGYSETDYFYNFGGTSASCPGMAGAAALMLSINNDLFLHEAKEILRRSCNHPKSENITVTDEYGHGIIDVHKLVQKTLQSTTTSNSQNMEKEQSNSPSTSHALHIALNYVSSEVYGSDLRLQGCEADAEFYNSLCKSGESRIIKNKEATRAKVKKAIAKLSNDAVTGDYVYITYAGHGSQVNDTNGDEKDGRDETLVLYDGMLIDDEINAMLAKFDKGVHVIWISDSCHSGTNSRNVLERSIPKDARAVSPSVMNDVYKKNRAYYDEALGALPPLKRGKEDSILIKANLISIGAVQDHQYAGDLPENGLFTGTLKKLYKENKTLTYAEIIKKVIEVLDPDQTKPKLTHQGKFDHNLEDQVFFGSYDGASTPPPTPDIDPDINDEEGDDKDPNEKDRSIYSGDNLILGSEGHKRSIKVGGSGNGQRGIVPNRIKLTDGTIPLDNVRSIGTNPWDKAYALVNQSPDSEGVTYAEPDLVSAINGDPTDRQQNRAGDYLETYPNPEARDNPIPIIWHLDDDHSQLRSAFNDIRKEYRRKNRHRGDVSSDIMQEDFPLIAHIDTGILPNHPTTPMHFREDLSRRFANPVDKDWIFGFLKAETQGHGQATATILAGDALGREHTGGEYGSYLGAFPYAQVMSLRISDTVVLLSGKKFADAVNFAIEAGADVITMSMAGAPSMKMLDAINAAYEAGVVVVSAAGNSWSKGAKKVLPDTVMYPARFDRVIGVTGATYDGTPYLVASNTDWKTRAAGGTYMQTCFGPSEIMGSIMAAYSPNITWADKHFNNGIYGKDGGGTSSATPQVAAAAAMWLHKHDDVIGHLPGWQKVEAVRKALFDTAQISKEESKKIKNGLHPVFGNGILRANDALALEPTPEFLRSLKKTSADTLENGWVNNVIDMFRRRSRSADHKRLNEMMGTEIAQLILTNEDLYQFQYKNGTPLELKLALLKNPNASSYLKRVISADDEIITLTSNNKFERSVGVSTYSKKFDLEKGNKVASESLIIHSSTGKIEAEKIIQDSNDDNCLGTVSIDLSTNRSVGSDLHISVPQNEDIVYLVELVDDHGTSSYYWEHPLEKKPPGDNRSMFTNTEPWTISLNPANRNIFNKVKKIIISAYKVVDGALKILSDKAPSKLQGLVYSPPASKNRKWKELQLKDVKNVKSINSQDRILLLCHGLFSSTELTFDKLLSTPDFLAATSGMTLLGFNTGTVKSSIRKNAADLQVELGKLKIDLKKIVVIGHSRGCLMAREAFDYKLNLPMFLAAGPHLGTPMARVEHIAKLLDASINMGINTFGKTNAIVGVIGSVYKYLVKGWSMEGITDMAVGSEFLEQLNIDKVLTNKQSVVGTNYVSGKKISIDSLLDKVVFKNEANDIAVPYDSALSVGVGNPRRISGFNHSCSYHTAYFSDEEIVEEVVDFVNNHK